MRRTCLLPCNLTKINPHLKNALPDSTLTASQPQSHSNKSTWWLFCDVENTRKDNQYVYLYKLDNRWVIGPHALAKDNRKCWAYSSVNDGRPTEAGFKFSSKNCSFVSLFRTRAARVKLIKHCLIWNQNKPMSWYEVTDPTEPNPVKRNRTIRIIEAAWANIIRTFNRTYPKTN